MPRPGLRRAEPLGRHRRLVIPRAYADVEPMLAAEQPDLVHIATPPPTPGFTASRRLVGRMRRIGRHVR